MNDPSPLLSKISEHLQQLELDNPVRSTTKEASVLLPLLDRGTPRFVGIVRNDSGIHGGQFALPGGRREPEDASSWATAVREMEEEVGLESAPKNLGELGHYDTVVSQTRVTVHVGHVTQEQSWVPEEEEVQGVFEVPVDQIARLYEELPKVPRGSQLPIQAGFEFDAEPYRVAGVLPARGRGHQLDLGSGPRDMPFIWGLTARILYDFVQHAWNPAHSMGE